MPGPLKFPPDHRPGLRVPHGGSMCANCSLYVDDGVGHGGCKSAGFHLYYGTDRIPEPPDEFCSDWYEPAPGALRQDLEQVGGISDLPKVDRKLAQIRRSRDGGYIPPPGPGTTKNHPSPPAFDPAANAIAYPSEKGTKPDPNTHPTPVTARQDARRARLPRQLPPTRHEEDYARGLIRLLKPVRAAYDALIRAIPASLEQIRDSRIANDRADAIDLKGLLAKAGTQAKRAISQPQVERLARKIAGQTSSYQKAQLSRQVKHVMTADPVFKDKKLKSRVDAFARENASLIRRIPEDLHDSVAALVTDAVSMGRLAGGRGRNPDSLRKDIEERFGVSERHARVIARDQTLKFYAAVNHDRQRELGVTRFTWMTVGDDRVRDEHDELDGDVFEYDDPPVVDGEAILPGDGVQCRCWAEPILDDLLEDQDADQGDDEDEENDDES